jgi:hypothetical protein
MKRSSNVARTPKDARFEMAEQVRADGRRRPSAGRPTQVCGRRSP